MGGETPIIAAGDVWISRMSELSSRKKDAPKFRELLSKANIRYYFDTIREVHVFYVRFPSDVEMSDLEFFRDFIVKLEKSSKIPVVEYEGEISSNYEVKGAYSIFTGTLEENGILNQE